MTEDSRKSFVGDFSEYDEDLDTLMNWIVTPMLATGEKPVALAHSMGAHNLLRRLARRPSSFAACVLSAPMIAISFRGQREFLVRAVTRYQMWRGRAHRLGVGHGGARSPQGHLRHPAGHVGPAALRTHPDAAARTSRSAAGGRDLGLAGGGDALHGLAARPGRRPSPRRCWWSGAGKDRICVTPQTREFAHRAPHADYVEIAEAGARDPDGAQCHPRRVLVAFRRLHEKTSRSGLNRSAACFTATVLLSGLGRQAGPAPGVAALLILGAGPAGMSDGRWSRPAARQHPTGCCWWQRRKATGPAPLQPIAVPEPGWSGWNRRPCGRTRRSETQGPLLCAGLTEAVFVCTGALAADPAS